MKHYLTTFADARLHRSLQRIVRQVRAMEFFDDVFAFDEQSLSDEFREKYVQHLIPGSRGFGYWCWKPECIKMALHRIEEGDVLIYVDVGFHVNKGGLKRLREYVQILEGTPNGLVAFQAKPPNSKTSPLVYDGRRLFDQFNFQWIKGDLFDFFGVRDDPAYVNSMAIGAGLLLIRKQVESLAFIEEWAAIIASDFCLLDDSPSFSANYDGFVEHRHDQAILTLLSLRERVLTLSAYEYWYPKSTKTKTSIQHAPVDWDALRNFPFHAKRDKDLGFF